jgi:hypothetical protein
MYILRIVHHFPSAALPPLHFKAKPLGQYASLTLTDLLGTLYCLSKHFRMAVWST